MSTQYRFVSKERKAQVSELKQFLEKERDELLERLNKFGKANPLVAEDIDDFTFSLRQCVNSATIQAADDDEHVIGTSTAAQFHWNPSSGFTCLDDVSQFLEKNPGYAIEDEYGSLITLANFKDVLKDIAQKGGRV